MNITINGTDIEAFLQMEQVLPIVGVFCGFIFLGWVVTNLVLQKDKNQMMERRVCSLERDWMDFVLREVDETKEKAAKYDQIQDEKYGVEK